MVVRVHQLVDHVGGRFELGVFVVALFERGKCRGKEIGQEIWEIMVLINKGKCIFYGENYVVIFNKFMFCVVSLSIMSW